MSEIDEYLKTVPEMRRPLIERALTGKARSPREAIKAKCFDCSGYSTTEAKNCKVWSCPLYPINPWRSSPRARESTGRGRQN